MKKDTPFLKDQHLNSGEKIVKTTTRLILAASVLILMTCTEEVIKIEERIVIDTVYIDTVYVDRVDTVFYTLRDTVIQEKIVYTDTVFVTLTDTILVTKVDTLVIFDKEIVTVVKTDTVYQTKVDTVIVHHTEYLQAEEMVMINMHWRNIALQPGDGPFYTDANRIILTDKRFKYEVIYWLEYVFTYGPYFSSQAVVRVGDPAVKTKVTKQEFIDDWTWGGYGGAFYFIEVAYDEECPGPNVWRGLSAALIHHEGPVSGDEVRRIMYYGDGSELLDLNFESRDYCNDDPYNHHELWLNMIEGPD